MRHVRLESFSRTALKWRGSPRKATLLLLGILSVGSGLGQVLDQEFDPEKSSAPVGVALGIGDQSTRR